MYSQFHINEMKVEIFERITSAFAILCTGKKAFNNRIKKTNLFYSECVCALRYASIVKCFISFRFFTFGSNTIYTNHMKIPTVLCGAVLCCRTSDTTKALRINWAHAIVDIKEDTAHSHTHTHTHVPIQSLTMDQFFIFSLSLRRSLRVSCRSVDDCSFFCFISMQRMPLCLEVFRSPASHMHFMISFSCFNSCAASARCNIRIRYICGAANGKAEHVRRLSCWN